ncbi:MAG: PPC domain-containing DNA-binding protein [Thermomicrobiales bacterium]
MKVKRLEESGTTTYALVFETGDEVMAGLKEFAQEQHLDASHFTAIGAFSDATLGFFDIDMKHYRKNPVREQVEVLSLVGDISLDPQGQPQVHAHVVLGCPDSTTRGGHLLRAHVRPTLEVMLVETPAALRREYDADAGLALIRL